MDRLADVPAEADGKVMLNVAPAQGFLGDKVSRPAGRRVMAARRTTTTPASWWWRTGRRDPLFLVKPSDVAIYVEHGAADIGIVGKDILAESGADVYELLDTGLGKCRMYSGEPKDFAEDQSRALRVATKFVNIAKAYYAAQGRDIDIIVRAVHRLKAILGPADVIVDIVETGTTLKENDLKVLTEFMPISARFIANRASYQFMHREIGTLLKKLTEVTDQ